MPRAPRRLLRRAAALAVLALTACATRSAGPRPAPQALRVTVALEPAARLVGLSGALRLEASERMSHAVERDGGEVTPITFGYDADAPAFVVEEESLPGGRSVFRLRPPYPKERHRLTLRGGLSLELDVEPVF
ncbi:MAG: hypothetical protein HY553_00035 [Elusimicrobia bacterium]|nr:hypothetical protein [Elusimicrobiota bacterium]